MEHNRIGLGTVGLGRWMMDDCSMFKVPFTYLNLFVVGIISPLESGIAVTFRRPLLRSSLHWPS
jgi:hypothetical protein